MADIADLARIIASNNSEGRYESVYFNGKSYGTDTGLYVYVGYIVHSTTTVKLTSPAGTLFFLNVNAPIPGPVVFRNASIGGSTSEFTFVGYRVYCPDMPVVRVRIAAVTRSFNAGNVFFLIDLTNGASYQYYQPGKTLATAIPESTLIGTVYDKTELTSKGLVFQV